MAFEVPVGRFSVSLVDVCHSRNQFSISCWILQYLQSSLLVQAGCARQQCPVSTLWLHEYCRWLIPAGLFGIAMSTLGNFGVMPLTQVCNWVWLTCFILYACWVSTGRPFQIESGTRAQDAHAEQNGQCLEHLDLVMQIIRYSKVVGMVGG